MQEEATTTYFLPAERLGQDAINRIAKEIAVSPAALSLALVPLAVTILNDTRQIVYANMRFVRMVGAKAQEEILGKRLGEALGCAHSVELPGGCGTTRFCLYCGAAKAIVKGLEGESATQECSIDRLTPAPLEALNLQVWTAPMQQGQHQLVLSSALDIAHEKALRNFERLFFHDILNAVSGIKGIHDLIALELPENQVQDLDLLRRAINDIQDIVETQKDFLTVEAREYQHVRTRLDTLELLHYLAAYCQSFNHEPKRVLCVDPEAPSIDVSSDARIIQRIMVNMVKNALEASGPGESVTLGCEGDEAGDVAFWVHNPAVMPEETRMRLFQRGFTTKGVGRGFGAYGMRLFARECLDGDVDFSSRPGEGTRFFLRLPG
ncbi:histidine kinase [Solidesulfovibrio fructosivorans JJ]]|uniref:histidine kinase n=2 Tax=Solidesulfovibrio fructosivorans TaxID=878 RepID=E1JYU3_SOLFR|nr:histidine kinase [Solidesulfovibrio fructosivorans JJ]]